MTPSVGLWNIFLTVITYLPWLIIALAAGAAFFKRKSAALGMQAFGAFALFGLGFFRWIVFWIMSGHTSFNVMNAVSITFTFLYFIAFLVFTAGFVWEKYDQWRGNSGAAFPVG